MIHKRAFQIEPRKFRFIYLAGLLSGLLLIVLAYVAGIFFVQKSEEDGLRTRVEIDAVMIEDHASRALETVVARLKSVSTFTSRSMLSEARLSSAALYDFIFEDPVIRSVSLVDDHGRVVASSTERNIGVVLPAGVLPEPSGRRRSTDVLFGEVFPQRDLYGIGSSASAEDVKFWVAAIAVPMEQRVFHWVIAVNLGFFQNFWARIDTDDAVGVGFFDYRGNLIVSHHAEVPDRADLAALLVRNAEDHQRGFFDFGDEQRFMAAYRGSSTYPMLLAVVGDRQRLSARQDDALRRLALAAVIAAIIVLIVFAILYRWYLRYEASVIEMTNQTRAIGAHLMVCESKPDGTIIRATDAFLEMAGYSREEVLGQTHRMFDSGAYSEEFFRTLWATVEGGKVWKGTLRNQNKAGGYFWVDATIVPFTDAWGKVSRYVFFYSDITEVIALSEKFDHEHRLREELTRINYTLVSDVNTDPLTGLSNRRALDLFTEQAFVAAKAYAQPISVLMLDLDHFKSVNDTYGHAAGDEVLREMPRRWESQIRTSDMLARLGGEEFCVVLPQTTRVQAQLVAEKIRLVTADTPVEVIQNDTRAFLRVTVSIGLASMDNPDQMKIKGLFELADEALYEAKRGGRNRVVSHHEGRSTVPS